MADADTAFRVPGSEWLPDEWVMKASRFVQVVVLCAGFAALFWYCFQATRWWGIPLALMLYLVSSTLHEAGHALGAMLGGATITRAQVGAIEISPLRDGARMRWKRGPREFAGFVQSFPSPRKSLRKQMILTTAAGPFANVGAAAVAFVLAHGRVDTPLGAVLLGFAAFNAAHAMANLLPWASPAMLATNGLQLLRWMRGIDDKDPQVALVALNARLISGERFGDWADEYLRVLERASQPGPMFSMWTRIRLAHVHGEWERVSELMAQVELQIIGLSPPLAKAMEGFIAVIRCEAAYARAMAGETVGPSPVEILGPDMGWMLPAVRLRCQALECLLHGHYAMAQLRLEESKRWSQRAVDRSLEHGEAPLREALAARIELARGAARRMTGPS